MSLDNLSQTDKGCTLIDRMFDRIGGNCKFCGAFAVTLCFIRDKRIQIISLTSVLDIYKIIYHNDEVFLACTDCLVENKDVEIYL